MNNKLRIFKNIIICLRKCLLKQRTSLKIEFIIVLKENSILKYLPINLNKRQFLIFDAIRFSLEIVEKSWNSLLNQIEFISKRESEYAKDLPRLFGDIWSVIDNVQRFINLHSQLHIDRHSDFLKPIKHIENFRHTLQHLDERIDQTLIDSDIPVYGVLSWNYFNPKTHKTDVLIASSGIARYNHKFNYEVPKFNKDKLVDNLIFESVIRINKNEFRREKLNLSKLISELIVSIGKIEEDLEIQFAKYSLQRADWIKRKDIIIRLNNK